jgi:hypothetical protein
MKRFFKFFFAFWLPVILFSVSESQAQDIGSDPISNGSKKQAYSLKDHIFFGGNVGAQFGTNTFVNIAPLIGYKITDKWSVGNQISYSYVNLKYTNYQYQDHIFGGSAFTRYFFFRDFFAQAEYEALSGHWRNTGERFNIYSLFIGGGYLFRFSDNAGFSIQAMYNVLPNTLSPYSNPVVNAGFTFGL